MNRNRLDEPINWWGLLLMVLIMAALVGLIVYFSDEIDSASRMVPEQPPELTHEEKLDLLYEMTVGENDSSLLAIIEEVSLQLDDLCLELARMQNLSAFECMAEPR